MRTFYEILRKLPAVLAGCLANWVKDIFLLKELMSLPDNDIQAMVCFFEKMVPSLRLGMQILSHYGSVDKVTVSS